MQIGVIIKKILFREMRKSIDINYFAFENDLFPYCFG